MAKSPDRIDRLKSVFIVHNSCKDLYLKRRELLALCETLSEVSIIAPRDDYAECLIREGFNFYESPMKANSFNFLFDIRYCFYLYFLIKRERPDILVTFTIKPNIYSSFANRLIRKEYRAKVICNITGLGTAFLSGLVIRRAVTLLYRMSITHARHIFFQNHEDLSLFLSLGLIKKSETRVLPGSGVNLERFHYSSSSRADPLRVVFIGRLILDKGVLEFLESAAQAISKGLRIEFWLVGPYEESNSRSISKEVIESHVESGAVKYFGELSDVRPVLRDADVVCLPSYREGMPRVVLEAFAMGKPAICADVVGCREVVEHGINGFLVPMKQPESLVDAYQTILNMEQQPFARMKRACRATVENSYSNKVVLDAYQQAIEEVD